MLPEQQFVFDRTGGYLKSWCRQCTRMVTDEWCARNRERINAAQRRWRAVNIDRRREHTRRYNKKHRVKLAAKQAARRKVSDTIIAKERRANRRYRERHADLLAWRSRARRAIKCGVGADLPYETWMELRRSYNELCVYCGERKPLTQDHVTPLTHGGLHNALNVVPACKHCNSSKGARPLLVFLATRRLAELAQ